MADPINLNRARKARVRAEASAQAAVNRVKFGRTKAEKKQADADRAKLARTLDQVRRDD